MLRRLAIALFRTLVAPAGWSFARSLADPARAQASLRAALARGLARTEYGRHLGVAGPADFAARVPVVDGDGLAPWLERQRRDEGRVLVPDPVLVYEKTSGSTGAAKLIPYTAGLKRSFSRMFAIWAGDLLAHAPAAGIRRFRTGRTYFCISPMLGGERATGKGVPVGLKDDSEYLDGPVRALLAPFLVMPRGLAELGDPRVFKRELALALAAAADLEVVSVWSPSFLAVVLDFLEAERRKLLPELVKRMDATRLAALMADPIDWGAVWPELKLVSCWDRAHSAPLAEALRARLPGIYVQGKGLLATEAPVTVPLVGAPGPVPLVDEVLIELEEAPGGRLVGLLDGVPGREYLLVLSTRGGLCRYRLGDRVTVGPRFGAVPTLDLVGRTEAVVDLVGEKLSEGFVAGVLGGLGMPGSTARVLVALRRPADHYVLLLDRLESGAEGLAARLDEALGDSVRYRQARLLGQLAPARVVVRPDAQDLLAAARTRTGQVWGAQKPELLARRPADPELAAALAPPRG